MPRQKWKKLTIYVDRDLEAFVDEVRAASQTEVVRDAIGLYRWIVERAKAGDRIQVLSPSGEAETIAIMGLLPRLAAAGPTAAGGGA